ncbi:unnamed protein product [Symbiodinium microadriaticum]|nr:unnamed protein product [Symbiodinium microadriaticum]
MEARALTDSELLEALTELRARIDQLQARVDHLLDLINRQYASIDRLNFRHSETWARLCSFGQRLQRVEGRPQDTDAEAASSSQPLCSFLQHLNSDVVAPLKFSWERFIEWGREQAIVVFPVTLDFATSFLKPLAASKQSSAIRETLETFNFLQHVVGMKVEPGILANLWIKGAVRGANMRTSDPRRSRVLTTSEVLLLETALIEGHHDRVDRYAIGAFLFQLYARARVSDLRNISKLELDLNDGSGFIEVRTYEHRNSRLGSGAGAVLILVAPYHGLHVQPWGQAWVQAASAVGFAFDKGHRGPILPRLSSDYSWSGDANANETTRWCRGILAQLTGGPIDETFSSHGLKATPLSWTSKAGYPERTQLILGHHSLGSTGKTQESYAREVQAQPLRDLVECIAAIRRGLFHPDRTRSGMVTQGALGSHFKFGRTDAHDFVCAPPSDSAQSSACEPAPVEAPRNSPREEAGSPTKDGEASSGCQDDVAEPQSEESESSGDSEGDIVYESFGKGIAQDAIPEVNMGPDLDIFQNPKTKSLHARAKGSTGKLICGRSLDSMKTFQGKDCGTMAQTLVESKAVFLERASRVGLPDEAVRRLVDQGIDTMSKLAFAPCQPGETPSEESLTGLIQTDGAEPSRGSIAAVRHLVFEAQTLLVSQTKALVENREAETKDLAPAERRERIKTQSQRLAGIAMSGQSECSFASYDLCMKLITENCVSYLAPSKFITREAELRADKPRKELDLQHSTLIVKEREPDQVCDTSTALSLHHALHRRGLALDLIGVTDYFKVQAFVDFLMAHLRQEPAAGSRATTVQQILLADRAAWLRLSELTPDGIRRDEAGRLPLDPLWKRLETDPKVIFHLLPREGGAAAPAKRTGEHLGDSETPSPGKKQRKGKGKGKTKTQKEPANLPEELKGLSSWTKTGKRRCWGFNMQDDVDADGVALEAAPTPASAITSPSTDQQLSSFFCVEVFAGSGRLTAELKSSGFRDSVGVDHVVPKHIVSPIVKLDLLEPDSVQMLFDMIDSPFCIYVHLAPPCGTASRAREIPGRHMPQPARSEMHPDGLPALQGPLLDRVRKANQLYGLAGRIFSHCMRAGKLVSCENPANSHFWNTSFWCQETAQLPWQDTLFHHCQHGGQRAKLTRLRHNIPDV